MVRASASSDVVLEDALIRDGWRVDGALNCSTTPEAAEKQLGITVVRTNEFQDKNFLTDYWERSFQLVDFNVVNRTKFNTMMQILVFFDKPKFTFGRGWYKEHILFKELPYVIAGCTSYYELVIWGPEGDPGGFGLLTIDPEKTTDKMLWMTYRSKARGLLRISLILPSLQNTEK
mmetsp:Transcript_15797/g.28727  ORF Transcript_15797/g.28727 Transcript_15797/m.28727 type:complete len:175 (-) Transcript_15797:577-1101(-)